MTLRHFLRVAHLVSGRWQLSSGHAIKGLQFSLIRADASSVLGTRGRIVPGSECLRPSPKSHVGIIVPNVTV